MLQARQVLHAADADTHDLLHAACICQVNRCASKMHVQDQLDDESPGPT